MSIATQPEAALAHLAGHDLVTVITIDRETPWRPRSPFDVPRVPRQVGGMPVQQMPLAELIEYNETAMRTQGRFWRLCPEMLDEAAGQLGHDRDAAGDRSQSADVEKGDIGRGPAAEDPAAETGDGRGDRCVTGGSTAGDSSGDVGSRRPGSVHVSEAAFHLLARVTAELSNAVFDQAAVIAVTRAGMSARIEAEDIRKAAWYSTDNGTLRRIRWDHINSEGGA
jgi:hypothetical protein